jgi:hypothetical protein
MPITMLELLPQQGLRKNLKLLIAPIPRVHHTSLSNHATQVLLKPARRLYTASAYAAMLRS